MNVLTSSVEERMTRQKSYQLSQLVSGAKEWTGGEMSRSNRKSSGSEVIAEVVTEKQIGAGSQLCVCSIYQDIPEKSGSICEPCRLVLSAGSGQGRTASVKNAPKRPPE
jgi:hypothetical protein